MAFQRPARQVLDAGEPLLAAIVARARRVEIARRPGCRARLGHGDVFDRAEVVREAWRQSKRAVGEEVMRRAGGRRRGFGAAALRACRRRRRRLSVRQPFDLVAVGGGGDEHPGERDEIAVASEFSGRLFKVLRCSQTVREAGGLDILACMWAEPPTEHGSASFCPSCSENGLATAKVIRASAMSCRMSSSYHLSRWSGSWAARSRMRSFQRNVEDTSSSWRRTLRR